MLKLEKLFIPIAKIIDPIFFFSLIIWGKFLNSQCSIYISWHSKHYIKGDIENFILDLSKIEEEINIDDLS